MLLSLPIKIMRMLLFVSVCFINQCHYYSNLTFSIYVTIGMLDFSGTAQRLWVVHFLNYLLTFLSIAFLCFQSKEVLVDKLPHIGWYRPAAFILIIVLCHIYW
jgi:hypothetical protein